MPFDDRVIEPPPIEEVFPLETEVAPPDKLQFVGVVTLAALLREFGVLTVAANEMFESLFEEANNVFSTIKNLDGQVRDLKSAVMGLSDDELSKRRFVKTDGLQMLQSQTTFMFRSESMPASLKPRYQSARPVPKFDQFDVYLSLEVKPAGGVATSTNNCCAAKYSDPFFFIDEWLKAERVRQEEARDRKEKKRKERKMRKHKKNVGQDVPKITVQAVKKKTYNAMGKEFGGTGQAVADGLNGGATSSGLSYGERAMSQGELLRQGSYGRDAVEMLQPSELMDTNASGPMFEPVDALRAMQVADDSEFQLMARSGSLTPSNPAPPFFDRQLSSDLHSLPPMMPPPPPMIPGTSSMVGATPPPPPPPTIPVFPMSPTTAAMPMNTSTGDDNRNALLSSIQRGANLKKVEPPPKPVTERDNLLSQIRSGRSLRPTQVNEGREPTPAKNDPYGQIKELLDRRQFLVPEDEDEDSAYESDEWE